MQLNQERRETFENEKEYINYLETQSKLPLGFSVGTSKLEFVPEEAKEMGLLPMTVTLIKADEPTSSFAAVFTQNKFPGGPIYIGRRRLSSSKSLQCIIVNNKISNVCPGGIKDSGVGDSETICESLANSLKIETEMIIPSSTGVIGWRLPVSNIVNAIPEAVKALQKESILPAASGICTTDRFPKVRRYDSTSDNSWSIVGIAKGAGMVEPNMATMLSYILTDVQISQEKLQEYLNSCVSSSFNSITVDGDQSTSDTVVIMSSNLKQLDNEEEFFNGLKKVCKELSCDIVRNGEGTQHVVKVKITGAPSQLFARDLGRFISNSNLVSCAIAGNDPNVGRIVGSIGHYLGSSSSGLSASDADILIKGMNLSIGGVLVFNDGAFELDSMKEKELSDYMLNAQLYPSEIEEHDRNYPRNDKNVEIEINLSGALGDATFETIGSDLTRDYVDINADYRS